MIESDASAAFDLSQEPEKVREKYGKGVFGQGCLMARRLVETGVPFVEVGNGGWDNHAGIHNTLSQTKLPELDKAMSALVSGTQFTGRGAGGASIDQAIAARVGGDSRFRSLQIGVSQECFGEAIQRNIVSERGLGLPK